MTSQYQTDGRTQLDHRIFGRLEAADDIGASSLYMCRCHRLTSDLPAGKSLQVPQEPFRPPESSTERPAKPTDTAPPRLSRLQRRNQPISSPKLSPLLRSTSGSPSAPTTRIPISPRPPPPTLPTIVSAARISDPKGFYALLGVTPTEDFLDPLNETMIARLLAEKRRTLALKFHADRGGDISWEGEMTRINVAYDQIRTCKCGNQAAL